MIKPQYWLRHLSAQRAIVGYPAYDMPHKGEAEEGELTEAQAHENFEYFMRQRQDRLGFFRNWLAKNFRLNLGLDGYGIIALEEWLWGYGGGFLKEGPNLGAIYARNFPPWKDALAGYNVAIDAAIFVGEFLISRRVHLHWTHCAYSVGKNGYIESRLNHPFIGGFPMKSLATDPIHQTFGTMVESLTQSKIGVGRYRAPRAGISYDCRSALYLANVPELRVGEVFTFKDYSNEPL